MYTFINLYITEMKIMTDLLLNYITDLDEIVETHSGNFWNQSKSKIKYLLYLE